jgi:hypothetical protein
MPDLLRLPLRAADLATRPARFVIGRLLDLRRSDDARVAPSARERPAPSAPVVRPAAPPPAPAPAAKKRAPAKQAPSPKAARRATRHEPTKGEAAAIRQQARMEEQEAGAEGGPGATIDVAEPWEGYEAMTEDQVLDRLTGAEPTLRAMVRLYESMHGSRRQILLATEETVAS